MTLSKDLALFEFEPEELNPYEEHFLLQNPFPGYGETVSDVCTDQEVIKRKFVSILKDFSPEAKRLRINGKNGAGKTNILRYFEKLTGIARESRHIGNIHAIYVYAPGDNYFDLHEQIVDELEASLLRELFAKLQSDQSQINKHQPTNELFGAIVAASRSTAMPFAPQEERQIDAFIRWLKGRKLPAADKKLLANSGPPPADITSTSLAIRYLDGLLGLLENYELCNGIVLLFDEFEEIFEGLSRSRQSRYAQDLRHLLDTLKSRVFFVFATVPEPKDLGQYPAIERRIGDPLELQPIDSQLALEYVKQYLAAARDKFEEEQKKRERQIKQDRPAGLEPLTPKLVEQEYSVLKEEVEEAGLDVLPGYFLPRMRERTRQIVEGHSQ